MRMVVLADDITGAFDTGIQFAKRNASVLVVTGDHAPAEQFRQARDVLVVDAETRHMPPAQAREETKRLAALAYANGAEYLYIKTDSGLRGNIAQAFAGAMEAWEADFAAFAPAYPAMNRLTVDGVQLIDDVPLALSVYGSDLFNPVSASSVANLFAGSGLYAVNCVPGAWQEPQAAPAVGIFDVSKDDDFYRIAQDLRKAGRLRITGGCAAFAAVLADFLYFGDGCRHGVALEKPLLTICGSLNPISLRQLDWDERHGGLRIHLRREQLLAPEYLDTPEGVSWLAQLRERLDGRRNVALDSCGAVLVDAETDDGDVEGTRSRVAKRLGEVIASLIRMRVDDLYLPFIIGGDTLMGFLRRMGNPEITLVDEIVPGVVMFLLRQQGREIQMLSKSGGFGDDALLVEMGGGMLRKVSVE